MTMKPNTELNTMMFFEDALESERTYLLTELADAVSESRTAANQAAELNEDGESGLLRLTLQHGEHRPDMGLRAGQQVIVQHIPAPCDGQFPQDTALPFGNRAEPAAVGAAPRGNNIAVLEVAARNEVTPRFVKGRATHADGQTGIGPRLGQLMGSV